MRRFTVLASAALLGVGVWMTTRVQSVNTACSATPTTKATLGANCTNSVSLYFLGFAMAAGGVVILLLALISMNRQGRRHRGRPVHRAVTKLRARDDDSWSDAA